MHKVALISGASRGLGKTVANYLATRGYDLVLTARGTEALDETAAEVSRYGGSVTALAGDISIAGHRLALAQAVERLGRLDLLINNASTLGPSPQPNMREYPLDVLRAVFETNVIAQIGLTQELVPFLGAAGGLVVNISSDAAVGGYEGWGGYGASKAALDLLSVTLANELQADGIAVVAVDPGDMRTQMHQEAFPGEDIGDRPLPEVTLPFWGWLLGQGAASISGQRFQAQGEQWLVAA